MNYLTKHDDSCPCKPHIRYTAEPCDNCVCLPDYGECHFQEECGDQYAGGLNTCAKDSLPGTYFCGLHGGMLESENALLKRRLELAAKKFDAFVLLVRDLLGGAGVASVDRIETSAREGTRVYGRAK